MANKINLKGDVKFSKGKRGTALYVKVIPRAKKDEIVSIMANGSVKVRLTAPPVEGKANEALIHYLSQVLDIPQSKLEIVAGETGRDKIIAIINYDPLDIEKRLFQILTL